MVNTVCLPAVVSYDSHWLKLREWTPEYGWLKHHLSQYQMFFILIHWSSHFKHSHLRGQVIGLLVLFICWNNVNKKKTDIKIKAGFATKIVRREVSQPFQNGRNALAKLKNFFTFHIKLHIKNSGFGLFSSRKHA